MMKKRMNDVRSNLIKLILFFIAIPVFDDDRTAKLLALFPPGDLHA